MAVVHSVVNDRDDGAQVGICHTGGHVPGEGGVDVRAGSALLAAHRLTDVVHRPLKAEVFVGRDGRRRPDVPVRLDVLHQLVVLEQLNGRLNGDGGRQPPKLGS